MPKDSRSRSRSRRRSPTPKKDRKSSPKKSRSRSRSRSGKRSRSRSPRKGSGSPKRKGRDDDDKGMDTIKLTDGDAAFILGKGGKTKMKIARVSGAELEMYERDLVLEIRGTDKQRRAAKKYAECVMAQRVGPVSLNKYSEKDGDQTVVEVPQECVGFVTGKGGNFLRTIEDEWGVIMFFVEFDSKNRDQRGRIEQLAIFGQRRARRGAELKVMTAVETKNPGFFTDKLSKDPERDDDWDTETQKFTSDEISYALGKQGSTRRKLERASECIIQYVGNVVHYAGTRAERRRAKEYMKWLFAQLEGAVNPDLRDRDDVTEVKVPQDTVGYITGARRAALSGIEAEWGVFMFFVGEKGERRDAETLVIFGPERGRKGAELKVLSAIETKNPGYVTRQLKEKQSSREDFGVDIFVLKDEDVSYALGKGGSTRMKLETASGCITQYVGNWAHFAGTMDERSRIKEYLQWLLAQRRGEVTVSDVSKRKDCTEMFIPKETIGWVTGNRGSELRYIEQETSCFLFMALDREGSERLLIFGATAGDRNNVVGRMKAERMVNDLVQERLRGGGGGGGGRRDSRGRSPPRRKDSRKRSPPRRKDSRRR